MPELAIPGAYDRRIIMLALHRGTGCPAGPWLRMAVTASTLCPPASRAWWSVTLPLGDVSYK